MPDEVDSAWKAIVDAMAHGRPASAEGTMQ